MTTRVFTVGLLILLQGAFSLAQLSGISTSDPSVQDEIIDKINALRRGVEPTAANMLKIEWNSEAASNAQSWAETCALGHSGEGRRTISTSGCGENIYMSSTPNSWSDAIQAWYDEVHRFQYGTGPVNGVGVGHYTQLVWYRSNEVGCGVAYCPDSHLQYFYVCQYCPPGNYQYIHPYKAGPSCGDCPQACDNKLCTDPCHYIDNYGNCPELKSQWGCSFGDIANWCPASCKCDNKIQ